MSYNHYPIIWVPMKGIMQRRSESYAQVLYWVNNEWIEDKQYKKIMKGSKPHYEFNVAEIDKWFEQRKSVA